MRAGIMVPVTILTIFLVALLLGPQSATSFLVWDRQGCVPCACKYAHEETCQWNDQTNCWCTKGVYRIGRIGRCLGIRECFPILDTYDD
ncbi:hypothetical protein V5799_021092 [Amblyomma americanum]|uniref:Secreted protein n=1 Tax=Amblyomma americanum TaxID=6943 RepID=A0AAQ4FTK9_AMBAM